jgi:SMODS-associated and fused to various effectors sensor domain
MSVPTSSGSHRRPLHRAVPRAGSGRRMITSSAHATATAVGIRDLVRQLAREHGAQRLHLFLAVPHGLALLLGHLWDRMPPTLV